MELWRLQQRGKPTKRAKYIEIQCKAFVVHDLQTLALEIVGTQLGLWLKRRSGWFLKAIKNAVQIEFHDFDCMGHPFAELEVTNQRNLEYQPWQTLAIALPLE
eukprot:5902327-Amphidinium_carterae.2